ncbi:MAG: DUF3160 domain-containing protein [Candidatus Pacebacteria bacterium]|nr:DUF3160 domain-containing protein [Candidatus Paceibacterota bacterium]
MKKRITISLILIVFLLAAAFAVYYFLQKNEKEVPGPGISSVSAAAKRLIQPQDVVLVSANADPKIPGYSLPLDVNEVSNWQSVLGKIQLSSQAEGLLRENGFVVIPTPESINESPDEFAEFYSILKNKDIPIFITSDSLLHYYHIFFDTTLMKLERDLFYGDLWQMTNELYGDAMEVYENSSGDLKEAAKRNVAYLSVAMTLLEPKESQVMSDATLREEYCHPGIDESWCQQMIRGVKEQYGEEASYKYFSQSEMEQYAFEAPSFVSDLVEREIELIEAHEGWEFSPIFVYKEDYSQYVPRGHYTKSEKLKNYFGAMMWYGRMTALVEGSPMLSPGESLCTGPMNGIISEYDAKIQTIQASLLSRKFLASLDIQEKWTRMYAITGFFVGFSDDLGPYEYGGVMDSLFEGEASDQQIEESYSDIKDALSELSYSPKIYGGLGACELFMPCPPLSDEDIQELKIQAKKLLSETKGFRMMGQRFTLDSWLFSEIVSPYSGEYAGENLSLPNQEKPFTFLWNDNYEDYRENRPFTWVKTEVKACPPPAEREVRGFPTGLDIMALFGSERAREILVDRGDADYSDYEEKFSELEEYVDSLPVEDYFQNLYWNWLYTLESLLTEFGGGYQTFMQTSAWQDKELNTALASWSELRHDTLLYVKQSYTMAEMGTGYEPPVVGYVEPVPEFYARLLTLTEMTNKGLKSLVPEETLEDLRIETVLERFSEILTELMDISKKELNNEALAEEEYMFIKEFGKTSQYLIETVSGGDVDPDVFKTVMVADVHTDGNTETVLEEGVGYIKTMLVAYRHPDGHILVGAGPVFSYYEFKQPMEDRLTDEAWREMLDGVSPEEPEWTKSFSE